MEMELLDGENIPYKSNFYFLISYKIGDSFVCLSLEEASELLEKESKKLTKDHDETIKKVREFAIEMKTIKTELYMKFGNSINLETD